MRGLVVSLLRVQRDLDALSDAAAALEAVVALPLSAADEALVTSAIAYASARALGRPGVRERLAALPAARARGADDTRAAVAAPERPRHALERACAWLDLHLDRFRVTAGARELPSIKSIAELAHAGEVLARAVDPRLAARGRAWIAHGWAALGAGAAIAARVEATAHDALLATVLPPFVRAGHRCDALLALVRAQIRSSLFSPAEWAYLAPVLRSLDLAVPAAGVAAEATASILATSPAPWTLALPAIYQLAHEVFYATTWGRDPGALPAASAAYVRRWLPCWLEHYESARDLDVAAELLAAAICAGAATPAASWASLAGAQADDGSLPPPAHRRVDWGADHPDDEAFARRHHPTLVAVIAWAI
ncbi:MAG: DUF6895 family protein [Acidobacteriota bacterium]